MGKNRKLYSVDFVISAKKAASYNKNFKSAAVHLDKLASKAAAVAKTFIGLAALKTGGGFALNAASEMENYRDTLNTVMKDKVKAAETMKWASNYANKTPFETDDVVKATVRLESYGLAAKKYLPTVGDMAAVMKTDVEQATEAIADAQMGELERLKEYGIKKETIIEKASQMFKDTEVVNAKGQVVDQIKFNEALMAVLEDRFKGGADSMSKTYSGAMSTIKGVSKSAIAKIMGMHQNGDIAKGSVFDMIKTKAKEASDYLQTISENGGIDKIQKRVSGFVRSVIDTSKRIIKAIAPIFPSIKNAFNTLKPYAKWAIDVALPKAIDLGVKVIDLVVKGIKFVEKHWDVIKPMLITGAALFTAWKLPDILFSKTDKLFKFMTRFSKGGKGFSLSKILLGKKDNLKLSFMTMFKDIPKLFGKGIAGKIPAVLKSKSVSMGKGLIKTIKSTLGIAKKSIVGFGKGVMKVGKFMFSPMGLKIALIIALIGGLVAAGIWLYKNWDTIKEKAKALWENIKNIFGGVKEWFAGIWEGVSDGFKGFINFIIKGINVFIRGLNKIHFDVPDWVPKIGGQQWGFTLSEIPLLANGGIATRATTAVIGEGAEPEAVLPLSKLRNLLKMNVTQNGSGYGSIMFAPQITIKGNASREDVEHALDWSYKKFKELMAKYEKDKKRLRIA